MAPKNKSLFRQPGVQHYQLVHRSQRDPLINDPDAGGRVLKSMENPNRKGKTRAEIEPAPEDGQVRTNEGEAAMYEIFYDDTDYDYMQHLRGVGDGGADSVLLSAPEPKAPKQASSGGFTERPQRPSTSSADAGPSSAPAFQLPASALPSTSELRKDLAYSRLNAALPVELQGLQPDMDPHLRQVLEALEDDAFVGDGDSDDGEDGGWLGELVETGEVETMGEVEEYEFAEWGIENGRPVSREEEEEGMNEEEKEERANSWQERFKEFKRSEGKAKAEAEGESDDDEGTERGGSASGWGRSEGGDTLGGLPALSVIGGKRRRKGAQSDASGYSMSSSSMFRNKGLSTLDEKFDRIEKIYEESESGSDNSDGDDPSDQEYDSDGEPIGGSDAPALVTREDFDNLLDDFLDNFEIVGNKLKPVMEGDGPMGKLTSLRKGLEGDGGDGGEAERLRILEMNRAEEAKGYDEESDDEKLPMPELVRSEKENGWDCESILSTYSTLENHPRLIDERVKVPKIMVDPKTGFPIVGEPPRRARARKGRRGEILPSFEEEEEDEEEELLDEDGNPIPKRGTLIRPKDETPAEKKARKAAVKEERQNRRVQKKSTKTLFSSERNAQINQQRGKVAEGRAADLSVASDRGKIGIVKLV